MNAPDAHLLTVGGEPSPPPLAPLPVLPGYAVEALVGRGGMGKVYRARHLGLGRVVAVKVLALDPDERSLARFKDEARAVAELQHPHVAQVFDTGTADGRPFFAQEFLEGGSLAQKFAGAPQDPKSAAEVVEIVARAIQHSHDHGILHRDLKPGNILLAADGTPKVTDFGLAKEIAPTGETPVEFGGGLTRTGEILGTPAYMPPEQASGVFAGIGPAADVYSLGAILYEAVTGRPPFQAPDALQTLFMVLGMDPVPPRTLQPKLPKDLETICLKCLEKSPRKRYPSAAALADDLHRFRTGEPILARPVGVLERAGKWARRKKAAAALLAVSVLFVLAVIGGAVWLAISNAQLAEAKKDVDDANAGLTAAKGELEKTNKDLLAAKAESDESFRLANDALEKIVRQVNIKLDGMPKAEGLMLDMLTQASELNRQLVAARPNDPAAVERYLGTLSQQVATEVNYGRTADAERTRGEMRQALAAALARWPTDVGVRVYQVQEAYQALAAPPPGQVRAVRDRVVELVDAFAKDFPDHPTARGFLVKKWWTVAGGCGETGDVAGQLAALASAAAVAREIPADGANGLSRLNFLTASLSQRGAVLLSRQRYADADATYAEVQAAYESVEVARLPQLAEMCKRGAAVARLDRAGIRLETRKPKEAAALFAEAEPPLRELERDFPLGQNYKFDLARCLYWQGTMLARADPAAAAKKLDEAVVVMDRLVKLVPGNKTYQQLRDDYRDARTDLGQPEKQSP